jgi:hypothetical protein
VRLQADFDNTKRKRKINNSIVYWETRLTCFQSRIYRHWFLCRIPFLIFHSCWSWDHREILWGTKGQPILKGSYRVLLPKIITETSVSKIRTLVPKQSMVRLFPSSFLLRYKRNKSLIGSVVHSCFHFVLCLLFSIDVMMIAIVSHLPRLGLQRLILDCKGKQSSSGRSSSTPSTKILVMS